MANKNSRPKWVTDFNALYGVYSRGAKKRKIDWLLTKNEFAILTQKPCYLCGRKPRQIYKNVKGNFGYRYNGVDRLDNNAGYTPENSRPCCGDCNRMKSDLDLDDFKAHVTKILKVIL